MTKIGCFVLGGTRQEAAYFYIIRIETKIIKRAYSSKSSLHFVNDMLRILWGNLILSVLFQECLPELPPSSLFHLSPSHKPLNMHLYADF